MTRKSVLFLSTALLVAAVARVAAGPPPAWQPQVDAVFGQWNRATSPGCALGIFQSGRIVYERGYGSADLEHGVPISPESVFYVGSLSKQFTAAAAALAIAQGRMAETDSIRTHLPELPAYAERITVGHLIHHTSGLRDYNTLLSIAGRRGDEAYDNATVLGMTARQKKLNFEPGDEYLYSNTGYTLLATIVQRATGVPFAQFAERHIFAPLQMRVTHYHVDSGRLIKGRAYAYEPGANGTWRLDTPSNERAGAGGVYTNVHDLLRWDENFYKPQVGDSALLHRLQTPGTLNNGQPLTYAWGLEIGKYRGLAIVEHGGSLGGYRAHLIRFPQQHASIATLCNLGTITPAGLVRQVADAVLAATFTEPKPSSSRSAAMDDGPVRSPSSGSVAKPADYAGSYYSDEIASTFRITTDTAGTLWLRRDADAEPAVLQPAAGAFRFRGMTVRFERDSAGAIDALVVDAGRVRDIRFVRQAR
jgi:CubicO group peptidase (beta-lactamase class C family)